MSFLPKRFDLTLCLGMLYFSIIFVYSDPVAGNLQRNDGKNYNNPFWTSILNQFHSKKAGQHSKRSGDLSDSGKILGKLSKLPAKLYQSFTKKSNSNSRIEVDDLEPRKSDDETQAMKTARTCSHCVVGNGVQTGVDLLVDTWFDSFKPTRNDRRSINRRSFGKIATIDIGKAVSHCMLGKGLDWGIERWWGSFNKDNNIRA